MGKVDLHYYSITTGVDVNFQTSSVIRTKTANFHTYSWDPETFDFLYGSQLKQFRKGPITYSMTLIFKGSEWAKRDALDQLHYVADLDIKNKIPGRLYWGKMYLECYIIETSTAPMDGNVTVENEITVFAPYPSWIYEVTYATGTKFTKAQVQAILEGLDGAFIPSALMNYSLGPPFVAPFHALPSDFRAILVGKGGSNAEMSISYTPEIDGIFLQESTQMAFISGSAIIPAGECIVVDARHGVKTITKYEIDDGALLPSTGVNIYNLRLPNSRPFKKVETDGNTSPSLNIGLSDCYDPDNGENVILTMYYERSEPTIWT